MGGMDLDVFLKETMLALQKDTNNYIEHMIEINGYYVADQVTTQICTLMQKKSDLLYLLKMTSSTLTQNIVSNYSFPPKNIRVVSKRDNKMTETVSVTVQCPALDISEELLLDEDTLEIMVSKEEIESIFRKTMTALPNLTSICLVDNEGRIILSPYNQPLEYKYLLKQCKKEGCKPVLLKKTNIPYCSLICAPVTPFKEMKWFLIIELSARLERGSFYE